MNFENPIEEIIRKRYSCRTYTNEKLDEKSKETINDFLNISEIGPFNTKARFLLVDTKRKNEKLKIGTYGMISGSRYFIVGIMNKDSLNYTDFGYLMEKMILKATDLNFGTVWLGRAFSTDTFSNLVQLLDNEIIPAISPIGKIATKKRAIDKFITWGIQARKRKNWDQLFFENDFSLPLFTENAEPYKKELEMVRLAPSARNIQPWRVVKRNKEMHFYIQEQSMYIVDVFESMRFIDIGIAMCHFELTAQENRKQGKWISKNPLLPQKPKNYKYIVSWIPE